MKKKIKIREIVGYSIGGLIGAFGLGVMITGLVGTYLGLSSKNPVRIAENDVIAWSKINLDFRAWGAIFILFGAIIAMFILLKHAKTHDLEVEKNARRAQRLGQ